MTLVILAGLFGLLIGSFLNACIHRLPNDLSLLNPRRSFCPSCKAEIHWYDNIPLISYLILGGKCRACKAHISLRYPIVEACTGMLFAYVVYVHGWNIIALKYCIFSAILVDLVFTDYEEYILPDEFTLGGAAVGLVLAGLTPPSATLLGFFLPRTWPGWIVSVMEAAFAGGLVAGMLWITGTVHLKTRNWYLSYRLYKRIRAKKNAPYLRNRPDLYKHISKRLPELIPVKEVLGLGDVKMLLTVGIFLGLPGALMTVFVGSILGSVIGLIYVRMASKGWDHPLPFGSFLGVAAVLVGLLGDRLFIWNGR